MSKSNAQDQVRSAAANEFSRSAALQAEFGGSVEAYVAYRCAMDRGAARISPATILHFKNHPAHAPHPSGQTAPHVEPGYGADSGASCGAGGFVYTGDEFASKLGPTQWACPVSDATLKVALGLVRSDETRHVSRAGVEQLIAKRAGVGLDEAATARAMAYRIKGQA